MVKAYPQFRSSYSHEEMVEHFLLTPAELQLVLTCRGDANRCGMALLLKTISQLGYVPDPMPQIAEEVRAFVAAQLDLLWDSSESNSWHASTLDYHLAHPNLLLLDPSEINSMRLDATSWPYRV